MTTFIILNIIFTPLLIKYFYLILLSPSKNFIIFLERRWFKIDINTLVAILGIGIPAINIIIPIINHIIDIITNYFKDKRNYKLNIQNNVLDDFLNSITEYCKEPNKINKNICYSYFSKLIYHFNVNSNFNCDNLFFGNNSIDFDELNDLVISIKNSK